MNIKKGDLIKLKVQNKDVKKAYLVLSIKKDKNTIIASRVDFEESDKKWHYKYINKNDCLCLKYDNFSVFNIDKVYKIDYELDDTLLLVQKIYDLHNDNKFLIKKERLEKSNIKRLKKNEKRVLASSSAKKKIIPSNKSMKSIRDINYKGHITIVRG